MAIAVHAAEPNFLFFWNHKVASRSLLNALEMAFPDLRIYPQPSFRPPVEDQDWPRFLVVRDPYARAVSCFRNKCRDAMEAVEREWWPGTVSAPSASRARRVAVPIGHGGTSLSRARFRGFRGVASRCPGRKQPLPTANRRTSGCRCDHVHGPLGRTSGPYPRSPRPDSLFDTRTAGKPGRAPPPTGPPWWRDENSPCGGSAWRIFRKHGRKSSRR